MDDKNDRKKFYRVLGASKYDKARREWAPDLNAVRPLPKEVRAFFGAMLPHEAINLIFEFYGLELLADEDVSVHTIRWRHKESPRPSYTKVRYPSTEAGA